MDTGLLSAPPRPDGVALRSMSCSSSCPSEMLLCPPPLDMNLPDYLKPYQAADEWELVKLQEELLGLVKVLVFW